MLCEGGGGLAGSLVGQGLADALALFYAPKVLADDRARAGFSGLAVPHMADAAGFRFCTVERVGEDILATARPLASPAYTSS